MGCARLDELPPPPPDKVGWPWTEESTPLPVDRPDGRPWPCLSIVTPSFNQGAFLEATIRSVLLQGYPSLEYFVLDGGSTDQSVEVVQKYSRWLTYWVSEPDAGQSAAINRGLQMGSGLYTTWVNSDDMLCQEALVTHARQIGFVPQTVYVGQCFYIDPAGRVLRRHCGGVHSFEDLVRIRTVWRAQGQHRHIVQPEVLFPRRLALDVGGLNLDEHRTMDYELWGKFFLAGARFQYTQIPMAMFRRHGQQKTHDRWRQTQALVATAARLVAQAEHLPGATRQTLLADLRAYEQEYWRRTGPLARCGLPVQIVMRLRDVQRALRDRARRLQRSVMARD